MSDEIKKPKNDIMSPAVGNDELAKNLGGMPDKKSLDEIHKSLQPKYAPPGVEKSKARVV